MPARAGADLRASSLATARPGAETRSGLFQVEEYAAALAGGASYGDIARAEGVTYATVRMRCRRAGLQSASPHRRPSPQTVRRVDIARKMLSEGCELPDVAERLGTSTDAVRMMLLRAARVGGDQVASRRQSRWGIQS
jgi:DNA-binding NarL/FixJ family response regulator